MASDHERGWRDGNEAAAKFIMRHWGMTERDWAREVGNFTSYEAIRRIQYPGDPLAGSELRGSASSPRQSENDTEACPNCYGEGPHADCPICKGRGYIVLPPPHQKAAGQNYPSDAGANAVKTENRLACSAPAAPESAAPQVAMQPQSTGKPSIPAIAAPSAVEEVMIAVASPLGVLASTAFSHARELDALRPLKHKLDALENSVRFFVADWCVKLIYERAATLPADESTPIDMLLFCPRCVKQHVDAPEPESGWTNPPHATHTCKFCGLNWRPSNALTNGVATIVQQEVKHAERIAASFPANESTSGNYTADREIDPTKVRFANGRTVEIVNGCLEIGWDK